MKNTWETIWEMFLEINMAADMAFQETMNLLHHDRTDEAKLVDESRKKYRECEITALQLLRNA